MTTPPSISGLEDHAGYWLRLVSNHVSQAFRLEVERRGVTVAEWVVLRELFDRRAVHPSRLSELLGLTRGAVSKLIDRLIAKKLVSCRVDTLDRRYQSLDLTAKGRKLVPGLAELADRNDQAFFGPTDSPDRVALIAILRRIAESNAFRTAPTE